MKHWLRTGMLLLAVLLLSSLGVSAFADVNGLDE